jgi:hypothetical protein
MRYIPFLSLVLLACSAPPEPVDPPPHEILAPTAFLRIHPDTYRLEAGLRDGGVLWKTPRDFQAAFSTSVEGKEIRHPFADAGLVEVLSSDRADARRIHLRLSRFPHPSTQGIVLDLVADLDEGRGELTIEVVPAQDQGSRIFGVDYPPPFVLPAGSDGYTVMPVRQGILIPSDHPEDLYLEAFALSRDCPMAWFGAVRDGQGYLAILETPFDGAASLDHTGGGPTKVRVRWRPSRGTLAYPRKVRYTLLRDADHTTLARLYRDHARASRQFRSLRDKSVSRPIVGRLRGAVILRPTFEKAEDPSDLRVAVVKAVEKGMERAILHLPRDCGAFSGSSLDDWKVFLGGTHESGWISTGVRDLRSVETDPEAVVWYEVGRKGNMLCPVVRARRLGETLGEVRSRGLRLGGMHLDGLADVSLFDCHHTGHPFDREGCAGALDDLMKEISRRGLVVIADEPAGHAFEQADLFDRTAYAPSLAVPAPLVSLVYHDAAGMGWDLDRGDDATDLEQYLHAALCGGMPALPIDEDGWLTRRRSGETDEDRRVREAILVERALDLASLHTLVWREDLLRHEFLTPDRMIQRSVFSNGVEVEVDFGKGEKRVTGP